MNRSEYIAQLTAALRGKLAFDEIEDIVRDYQEFFDEGVRQGKSEEQVAAELGNPRDVAQQILSEERETPSSGTASSEGGFRDSFTRGAEKVADSADQFAKKANAFTRRKMEEHEQRKARRQEERASRAVLEDSSRYSRRSGCLGALLKLAAAVIAAPFALAFLICCLVGVILGVAGVVAAICGFVVLGMVLPLIPFTAIACAVAGLIFVIFFCITAVIAVFWLLKAVLVFIRDLLFGRRIDDDYFDRAFRVSEDPNAGWHFRSDPGASGSWTAQDSGRTDSDEENWKGGDQE